MLGARLARRWDFRSTRRKSHGVGMHPRADDKARAQRHAGVGLAADRLEIPDLRGQERIVPTPHQQHRGLDVAGAVLAVDRPPVGIGPVVHQPVVEERHVADRAIVGLDHRESLEPALQCGGGGIDVRRTAASRRPEQRRLQ